MSTKKDNGFPPVDLEKLVDLLDSLAKSVPIQGSTAYQAAQALRRYLIGEVSTLDQAFGVKQIGRGNRNQSPSEEWDIACWLVFIRRELVKPKVPWRTITKTTGIEDTPELRRAYKSRKGRMMARALELALKHNLEYPVSIDLLPLLDQES